MPVSSDLAEMSSLRTQLEELRRRLGMLAEQYRDQTDVTAGGDLFNAERSVIAAARSVERAVKAIERTRG